MLDSLFSPITINKRQLKNRCIVPAMVMNLCEEDGSCTERFAAYHEAKAKGGFAMIITEDFAITNDDGSTTEGTAEGGRQIVAFGKMSTYPDLRSTPIDFINGEHCRSFSFTIPDARSALSIKILLGHLRLFRVRSARI